MATRFSSALLPTNATDADFRAWAQFIEDTLVTTGGWVVTADTGQMTIGTSLKPAAVNTKVGYRVYRMADALQATQAVFMRVDYGSASVATIPGYWITIGQSTDGAGTITNVRYNGGGSATPNVFCTGQAIAGTFNTYGSASTGRVSLAMFVQGLQQYMMGMTIERTKDLNGLDTADGLIVTLSAGTGTTSGRWNVAMYLVLGGAGQPPADTGLQYLLPSANPGTYGSDVGVGVHVPFAGIAKYPALGVVAVRQADFAAEASFNMTMYGSVRTYQHMNTMSPTHASNGTADANARICIRYD